VAENLHVAFHGEEPLLGRGQEVYALYEVPGDGLEVASAQETARHKIIGDRREIRRMRNAIRTVHEPFVGRAHPYNECISFTGRVAYPLNAWNCQGGL